MQTSRPQATRARRAAVHLHMRRQHLLGERLIGDHDRPRRVELLATGLVLVAVFACLYVWS